MCRRSSRSDHERGDRPVPGFEPPKRFSLVPSSHAGGDAWRSTLGAHRFAEMVAAIGAVGKNLAGIVGQSIRTDLPSLMLAGVMAISLTRTVSTSAPTWGFEAMNCWSALC